MPYFSFFLTVSSFSLFPLKKSRSIKEDNIYLPFLSRSHSSFYKGVVCLMQVDVAILEVGLGGRLDATNVVSMNDKNCSF